MSISSFWVMSVVLVAAMASTAIHAEDDVSLPVAAQKILTALTDDITIAKQKAVKDLRKLASDLGKQDDLDAALVVKKTADELNADIKASQPEAVTGIAKLTGVAAFNGRWLPGGDSREAFEFKAGKYTCLMGSGVGQLRWASGEIVLVNPTTLLFTNNGATVVSFRVVDADTLIESNGNKIWTRMKVK